MRSLEFARRVFVLALVLATAGVGMAVAQTGNLYGTVADEDGAPLPGVTVTMEGAGAPRVTVTDEEGQFRILNIDPGSVYVKAELDGFSTVEQPNVVIRLNRNTTINFTLSSAVEEVITVTSESPLLDTRKLSSGTTVSQVELEKIPTARDPWSLLSQTPGVAVDRINVGGSESGQQSVFRGQGVASTENDFLVDGIQITDMGATGSSPTYYDFDQFAEVSMSTGGTDVTKSTAGVEVNMVTKRGTNEFRGSTRFYIVKAKGYFNGALDQADLDVSSELCDGSSISQTCPNGIQTELTGASINTIQEVGFEAGGPAVPDRVWLWGSWGQSDIKTFAASGDADNTLLENTSIKINAQLTSANSGVASYNNGDKIKNGRGAGPDRSPGSLWDQRGPSAIYRFEDTHVFSSNFFATGTYSIVDLGFALTARGDVGTNGLDPAASDPSYDASGVWQDNFLSGRSIRPGDEYKIDTSYFFNTGEMSHELKVGGRYRSLEDTELFSWGPRNLFTAYWGATVARHSQAGPEKNEYISLWAQDTIAMGNATFNVGFRYDDQKGKTEAVNIPAHPCAATPTMGNCANLDLSVLPAFSVSGKSNVSLESISPRLGVTYALGEQRKTLLRASYSQFAAALSTGAANWTSPTYYGWYAYFYNDANGNPYLAGAVYFDPLNPTVSPNRYGKELNEHTDELIAGVEHAFLPEFVVGANLTWRKTSDINDYLPMVRDGNGGLRPATLADYTVLTTQTGTVPRTNQTYSLPYYGLACQDPFSTASGCPSGGQLLFAGDRSRDYLGGSVTFTKRLANRWSARGFVNWGDAEWNVPSNYLPCINNPRGGGCVDGDLFTERSTGSGKGERYLQSSWSFNLNGLYQVAPDRPWGFNVSANINGREGYPIGYNDRVCDATGCFYQNVVPDLGKYRLDDVITADARIEKVFALSSPVNLNFGLDVFNVTNENTGLAYQPRTDVGTAGFLFDNIAPRVYRLSVRLTWK